MDAQTEALLARLDSNKRNERHANMSETMHWFRQWKLLAEEEAAKIRSLYAQLDARAMVDAQRESYISDLQAELKAECTARETDRKKLLEADTPGGWIHDLRIKAMSDIQPCCGEVDTCQRRCVPLAEHWKQRAESLQAKLVEVERETIEKMKVGLCETCRGKF